MATPRTRHAYFGPEGTFTEAALRTLPDVVDPQPFPSVPAALDAVRRREADAAMVPLENSVEGAVGVTLDELALGEPLVITGEVFCRVVAVMARSGTALDDSARSPLIRMLQRRYAAGWPRRCRKRRSLPRRRRRPRRHQ